LVIPRRKFEVCKLFEHLRRKFPMKKLLLTVLAVFCLCAITAASDDDDNNFSARLRGLTEVPPVATAATGSFSATLSSDGTTLTYKLTYHNLNAQVLFSHIHFGFPKETGGVMVFLCGPAAGAPGGPPAGFPNPPACPDTTSGTVTGTLTAAEVVGPNNQGITPKADFAKVVRALREGASYVNVHSTRSPGGEIRGLVRAGDGDRDDR
jgi:CHRD domain